MSTFSRRHLLEGAAALAAFSLLPRRADATGGLAVVVGKANPATSISKVELKRLFLGTPVTLSGQALVPFNSPPGSPERVAFEKIILDMAPDEVTKTWVDLRIRAQAKPPKTAPTSEVLLKLATAFPGATCYLPMAMVTPAVKALAIDGKRPGDPGYLLG